MLSKAVYLVALAGLLAACAAPATPSPAPTAALTSGVAITVTPASGVGATATAIDHLATSRADAQATLAFSSTATASAPTPDLKELDSDTYDNTSPGGHWVARWLIAFDDQQNTRYLRFWIERADGLRRYVLFDAWEPMALGMTVPRIVRWSSDGQHVYYTNQPSPDGCVMFVNGWDLWRVDLSDGSQEQLVEAAGLMIFLSPGETTLLYESREGYGLTLRDLESSGEQFVPLDIGEDVEADDLDVVSAVWSPDESAILVTVYNGGCPPPEGGPGMAFTIVRVELSDLSARTLIEHDKERQPVVVSWPEPDRAVVQFAEGSYWLMDPQTGEILGPYDGP